MLSKHLSSLFSSFFTIIQRLIVIITFHLSLKLIFFLILLYYIDNTVKYYNIEYNNIQHWKGVVVPMNQNLLIQSFLSTWAFMRLLNLSTRSILTPILCLFCFVFFRYSEGLFHCLSHRRLKSITLITSILFTAFFLAGEHTTIIYDLNNRLFQGIILLVSAAGLLILLYHILLFVFSMPIVIPYRKKLLLQDYCLMPDFFSASYAGFLIFYMNIREL